MYESIDWRQSTKGGEEFARFSSHTSTRAGCRKRVSGRVPDSISFDFNRNLENDEKCKLTLIKQKFILHPLIHTFPSVTSAQNVGGGSYEVSDHERSMICLVRQDLLNVGLGLAPYQLRHF